MRHCRATQLARRALQLPLHTSPYICAFPTTHSLGDGSSDHKAPVLAPQWREAAERVAAARAHMSALNAPMLHVTEVYDLATAAGVAGLELLSLGSSNAAPLGVFTLPSLDESIALGPKGVVHAPHRAHPLLRVACRRDVGAAATP